MAKQKQNSEAIRTAELSEQSQDYRTLQWIRQAR